MLCLGDTKYGIFSGIDKAILIVSPPDMPTAVRMCFPNLCMCLAYFGCLIIGRWLILKSPFAIKIRPIGAKLCRPSQEGMRITMTLRIT